MAGTRPAMTREEPGPAKLAPVRTDPVMTRKERSFSIRCRILIRIGTRPAMTVEERIQRPSDRLRLRPPPRTPPAPPAAVAPPRSHPARPATPPGPQLRRAIPAPHPAAARPYRQ